MKGTEIEHNEYIFIIFPVKKILLDIFIWKFSNFTPPFSPISALADTGSKAELLLQYDPRHALL